MTRLPAPGDVFGRYRLIRQLGLGGMGVVYAAHDETLDREVAIKLIAPQLAGDEAHRARFDREAATLARIDSPHVVSVHDYGDHDGTLFLVTQLISGGDLAAMVHRAGVPEPGGAVRLAAEVLSGLGHAHAAGVTHRDIKPTNVLLRPRQGGVDAVLCDFGIASMPGHDVTRTGAVSGSLAYMSPERHRGEAAGVPADIYAAGCLLWFLLTGAAVYAGTEAEVALAHLHAPLPRLPGRDEFSRQVNRILEQSLAKAPADRYRSAEAMRRDLVAALAVAPTSAIALPEQTSIRRPITGTEAAAPAARRTSTVAVAAAAAVALVVIGGIYAAANQGRPAADGPPRTIVSTVLPPASPSSTVVEDLIVPDPRATRTRGRKPGKVPTGAVAPPSQGDATVAGPTSAPSQGSGPRSGGGHHQAAPTKSPSPSPSKSPSPSPTPTQKTYAYTCWSGSQADSLDQCGTPTGEKGLRYLYSIPSFCPAHPNDGRIAGVTHEFTCETTYDGEKVWIWIEEWTDGQTRNAWAGDHFVGGGHDWMVGGSDYGTAWAQHKDNADSNMDYQVMKAYSRGPFSVQIRGESDAGRTWGANQMSYRSPDQWKGYAN